MPGIALWQKSSCKRYSVQATREESLLSICIRRAVHLVQNCVLVMSYGWSELPDLDAGL
jgi:hypothetical protein